MKEKVYDEQINPLMAEILEICKRNRIAFLADFALDEGMHCTSAILEDDCNPSDAQLKAFGLIKPQRAFAMTETHTTLPDGRKKISLRRIS